KWPRLGQSVRRRTRRLRPFAKTEKRERKKVEGRKEEGKGGQRTNIPMAAANMTNVVIATIIRERVELGWFCINLRSQATYKMPTRRKGARTPLMTAVQKSVLTGLMSKKSIAIPTRVETMRTV